MLQTLADMLAAVPSQLTLEVIEGPGAGKQIGVDRPIIIGRGSDADLILEDGEVSRRHARLTPAGDGSVEVEDLGSANGTFINHNEVVGPSHLDPGDELLLGVTVLQLRSADDVAARGSAVIQVPPSLATAPRPPSYVNPEVVRAEAGQEREEYDLSSVEKYLDVRVRRRAQLAPLAMVMLIAIALIIYFAAR
jgi:pSer/pThr/pTyr-binding forkhead associated (FHA) protein